MNAQTLTTSVMTCDFVVAIPQANFTVEEPMCASSRDYGFDFDEAELAEEFSGACSTETTLSETETSEFERSLRYYFS